MYDGRYQCNAMKEYIEQFSIRFRLRIYCFYVDLCRRNDALGFLHRNGGAGDREPQNCGQVAAE
jgi:hypothetical protein